MPQSPPTKICGFPPFVSKYTYGQRLGKQRRRSAGPILQLSRTRIANDLSTATHPNHRKSLEAALAHLDKKIADLS